VEDSGKAAIAEFIGTFALIFFGAGSVVLYLNGQLDLVGVALAHGPGDRRDGLPDGASVRRRVQPAIQVALWVTGKTPSVADAHLLEAQLLGGICGALLLKFLVPAQAFDAAFGGTPRSATASRRARASCWRRPDVLPGLGRVRHDDRRPRSVREDGGTDRRVDAHVRDPGDRPVDGRRVQPARWFGPALASGEWDDWFVWIVGPQPAPSSRRRVLGAVPARQRACHAVTRSSLADTSGSLTRP
jgi:hypothetical protein